MIVGECIDQQLDRYRLIRLLGQSGSSEVYLGENRELRTPVAIKMLYRHFARSDREIFLAQASTLSRLEHPHIVQVRDFGMEKGTPYLVMTYAPHGNMRQRYPRGTRLSLETIVFYVKQVANALQYIHERTLIHRDIKPHNMLLGPDNQVLLSDFGIAITSQSIDANLPGMPDFEGTVLYAAPEQLQGKPRRCSDQYALGVVAYEWLSGEWPFRGSFYEVARQHMFDAPPSLRRNQGINIAPAVEEVVLKALAKDPRKRFGSVREFAEALECASYEAPATAFAFQARPGRQFISPFPFV
ncbi:MAG TPA: serine/threonine-protein kinase [Ktedonobacteraceae bacterium]